MTLQPFRFRSLMIAFLTCAAIVTVSPAYADVITFGNFSQFTINQDDSGAAPIISIANQRIQLTNAGSSYQARSIFYDSRVPITNFEATFLYRANPVTTPTYDLGLTFTIQNSVNGASAVGDDWYHLGYDGIGNSIALSLELGDGSRAGLYQGGNKGFSQGQPISPVNFDLGNPISVDIKYDGTILSYSLKDTVTDAVYQFEYLKNIPAIIGSSSAFIGFTGSTGSANVRDQFISDFRYTVPEPGSLLLGSVASLALLGCSLRQRFCRATDRAAV